MIHWAETHLPLLLYVKRVGFTRTDRVNYSCNHPGFYLYLPILQDLSINYLLNSLNIELLGSSLQAKWADSWWAPYSISRNTINVVPMIPNFITCFVTATPSRKSDNSHLRPSDLRPEFHSFMGPCTRALVRAHPKLGPPVPGLLRLLATWWNLEKNDRD
jgi:hypothetical protein